jgi:hypothetical protein
MKPISHIKSDGRVGSCIFNYPNEDLMNLYRRAILSEIETYAIEYACFDINISVLHDELLGLRLAQLVIDHDKFINEKLDEDLDKRYYVDVSGPGKVTTDDIIGLPFTRKTTFLELQAGERVKFFVMVRKGIARTHVKWRPVGLVAVTKIENGFFISQVNPGKEFIIKQEETHYIDTIIIKKNTTYIIDRAIATSIAALEIDYENFSSDANEFIISLNKTGPGYLLTSSDELPVPFKFHLNIGELQDSDEIDEDYDPSNPLSKKYKGQEIECDIIIRKGKRTPFIKWKTDKYNSYENATGFQFVINNVGMLSTADIFNEGLKKIRMAASRADTPKTIFHKVVVPDVIPDEIPY